MHSISRDRPVKSPVTQLPAQCYACVRTEKHSRISGDTSFRRSLQYPVGRPWIRCISGAISRIHRAHILRVSAWCRCR